MSARPIVGREILVEIEEDCTWNVASLVRGATVARTQQIPARVDDAQPRVAQSSHKLFDGDDCHVPESKSMSDRASDPERTIQFVCEHGAFRCRIAAAYFDALAPEGWSSTTGGVTPQAEVSERLLPTIEGSEAEQFVDTSAPRAAREAVAARTIVIDADLPIADEAWRTSDGEPLTDEELREQIKRGVERLIRDLAD